MNLSTLNDFVWPSDSPRPYKPNIPEEQHYGYPTGWICPKCGRVYAPFMSECLYCNKPDFTVTCTW